MPENSERTREERAERLRKQIDELSRGTSQDAADERKSPPESAAEFIHRKMHELDQKKS